MGHVMVVQNAKPRDILVFRRWKEDWRKPGPRPVIRTPQSYKCGRIHRLRKCPARESDKEWGSETWNRGIPAHALHIVLIGPDEQEVARALETQE